ncbi:MAG: penicillin acylase family protein [Acidobacteriota bacterium]|nr:penicillin acylase family protein [Acidobacteriota bacterium]
MRRVLRYTLILLAVIIGLIVGGGVYARSQLKASLPIVDGSSSVPGLAAPARVERDALGVPTITAGSREDAARALGFLHAQDRFFQMDLQRRQPAGELSGLVGIRALEVDEEARVHRFRDVAHRALELTEPSYRRILDAYAEGVNAGLGALGAAPFEYLVLRAVPEPWQAEDSILTVLAMFNTLQGRQALFERTLGAIQETMPEPMFRFLMTAGSEWDTPVIGSAIARPPIPGPEVFDLRHGQATETRKHPSTPLAKTRASLRASGCNEIALLGASVFLLAPSVVEGCFRDEHVIAGSNNWAVDAAHSASGTALVANDMHLAINVPIIWYRASMAYADSSQPKTAARVTGVTLPGLPSIVVGSNGQVAWGFTNSGGDWSDLVRIDPDPREPSRYLTPEGPKPFETFSETILAKGAASQTVQVRWTMWGPIVWKDAKGREYAQRWIAHDAQAISSDVTRPERAQTVDEVLAAVAGLGIPNQNVTAGDTSGRIGWTIGGAIPRRVGHDGLTPASWADGTHRWDGYLPAGEFPRITNPEGGRIWTANAPVVDGAMLATIGEGGYADGIRARLIRDRLMAIDKATPKDMLAIQLENKALFLDRWRTLVLEALQRPDAIGTGPHSRQRAEFGRLVETTWTGRASPDSVAYRLVRQFRAALVRRVMTTLTAPARRIDPAFDYTRSLRGESPVWQLVSEKPAHLLDPQFKTWDEQILFAVDVAIGELAEAGPTLADRTWGEFNRAQMFHPLASGIPFFGRYLNMPSDPLPGDVYTPRAHSPRAGPSQRMAVSPGLEKDGIMEVPTGQSGHPLSPHYGDQYRAWLNGEPSPFLPGPTVSTLTLTPR